MYLKKKEKMWEWNGVIQNQENIHRQQAKMRHCVFPMVNSFTS